KHLATFRRVLESIEPDDFGRRTYTLDYLSNLMRKAKSPTAPRTIQSYLAELRKNGEIVTAQIGGNGRPYAVLTSCFGGANKSKTTPKSTAKPAQFGGANRSQAQPIATPQIAQSNAQAVVDHLNLSALPAVPSAPFRLADMVRLAFDA